MASLKCAYCSASLPVPRTVATVRCGRCGAVHHADGEVISPRMLPAYQPVTFTEHPNGCLPGYYRPRISPWMLMGTRPIEPGFYDVRYRDLEKPIVLFWSGRAFLDLEARRVSERTLLTWRGAWE